MKARIFTQRDIEKHARNAYNRGVENTFVSLMNIICMGAHDKLGIDDEKVDKLIDYIQNTFDAIDDNYINLNELEETTKEEYGRDFREEQKDVRARKESKMVDDGKGKK